jgi:hypothetical protein
MEALSMVMFRLEAFIEFTLDILSLAGDEYRDVLAEEWELTFADKLNAAMVPDGPKLEVSANQLIIPGVNS